MSDLAAPVRYQDRSTGLILVGILEICLGLLCLLMLVFTGFAAVSAKALAPQVDSRSLAASGLFYLAVAVFFGTMGIGTLRGRRWARTLMLVTSWIWLITGVFSTAVLIFLLPRMTAALTGAGGAGADAATGAVVMGCVSIVLGLFYLVLPGVLLLFYRGPNVRATFEAKDPNVPWTDRVPSPVLALTLLLAFGALSSLTATAYGVLPIFNTLLKGTPAVLAFLAIGVVCALLAWGTYHQRPAAWWTMLVLWVLGCINSAVFLRTGGANLRDVYVAMGTPPAQLEQIDRLGIYDLFTNPLILSLMVALWLGWLGFLIWMKRFFPGKSGSMPLGPGGMGK